MNEATTAILSSLHDASIDALSVFEDAVSIQFDDVIIDGRSF
ncbi:hypothetical protein [Pseudovibrio denitrificans]|nr:hypothetical protein [Pseudovibrio denitrificans]